MHEQELTCHLPEGSVIKVIGLGGVGGIVSQFLTVFLKSLGKVYQLVLIDGDTFELKNQQRMIFSAIGNKAKIKAKELGKLLGSSLVTVSAIPEYVVTTNVAELIAAQDIVFLCVDNHGSRKLVSEHCRSLTNSVLLSGGNSGVEPPDDLGTYGNVQIYVKQEQQELTVPITKYHPEIDIPADKLPTDVNCLEAILSTPQILFSNLAVASHMLNAFFALTTNTLTYQENKFDIIIGKALPQLELTTALRMY